MYLVLLVPSQIDQHKQNVPCVHQANSKLTAEMIHVKIVHREHHNQHRDNIDVKHVMLDALLLVVLPTVHSVLVDLYNPNKHKHHVIYAPTVPMQMARIVYVVKTVSQVNMQMLQVQLYANYVLLVLSNLPLVPPSVHYVQLVNQHMVQGLQHVFHVSLVHSVVY